MQMCKWHWECCEALLGNTTPLGRLSGRQQLFVKHLQLHNSAPRMPHLETYSPHALTVLYSSAYIALAGSEQCGSVCRRHLRLHLTWQSSTGGIGAERSAAAICIEAHT